MRIGLTVEDIDTLESDEKVEDVVVLSSSGRGDVLGGEKVSSRVSHRPSSIRLRASQGLTWMAPAATVRMVVPEELKAFQSPKAVPMLAWDGTRRGMDARKGSYEEGEKVSISESLVEGITVRRDTNSVGRESEGPQDRAEEEDMRSFSDQLDFGSRKKQEEEGSRNHSMHAGESHKSKDQNPKGGGKSDCMGERREGISDDSEGGRTRRDTTYRDAFVAQIDRMRNQGKE